MQKYKLNEWVIVWLKTYKRIMVKPSTFDSYLTYAVNVTCDKFIDELSFFDVQCMVNNLVEAGRSTSTIKHMLTIVRQSLVKARAMGIISDLSCMDGIEIPKSRKKIIMPFSDHHTKLILDNLHRTHYADLYLALLYTGCRIGELVALRWCDVDLFNKVLYINHTDYKGQLQSVKTEDGERVLPMNSNIYFLFRRLHRSDVRPSERVFLNTLGNPIKYRTLLDNWHWFCDSIGIPQVGFHVFRHTFAHNALRAGVPIKVVSAWLGHSDVYITLQIYDNVTAEDMQAAAQLIEKAF